MAGYRIYVFSLIASASVWGARPALLYTDLESGPNTGGQDNGGAFVTVYGNNFGATRGSSAVTIGGARGMAFPVWTDSRITFQVPESAATGNIIVTVNGQDSNPIPFTVRAGAIYFVARGGSDSNPGTFGAPWQTLQFAVNTIGPGDIIYAMDGVVQSQPNYDGSLQLNTSGAAGSPKALVAYPGATVTIGGTGSSQCTVNPCYEGLRNNTGTPSHWVFANLVFRGNDRALNLQGSPLVANGILTDLRFVGDDFSCPWGGVTPDACVVFGESQYIQFYGNSVHDVATLNAANAIDEAHGLYFSSDVSHVDAGWNQVYNIMACRGVQVHSSQLYSGGANDPTGFNVFDIKIHDNLVHDTRCDGIILATVAPEQGKVELYNNVIYSAGVGPLPQGGGGGFTCLYIIGGSFKGPDPTGTVEVYNNTFSNCGPYTRPDHAAVSAAITLGIYSPKLKARLRNNIFYQKPNELYTWDYNAPQSNNLTGTNNLFFGSSTAPQSPFAASISGDPLFVNLALYDFHLKPGSPAKGAGVSTGLLTDRDGVPRPWSNPDFGAYQVLGAASSVPILKSIACDPGVITTPGTTACRIDLSDLAPDGGLVVSLSSDSAALSVPQAVLVAAQSSVSTTSISAAGVIATQQATLLAALGSVVQTTTLILLPPNLPGSPAVINLLNSANLLNGAVSPGEIVSATGSGMGPATGVSAVVPASGLIGTMLSSTRVLFDSIPAALLYVQQNQINLVVPYEVASRSTTELHVEVNGLNSNSVYFPVVPATPAIFSLSSAGTGQAAAINQNGTRNLASNPAPAESIVALYATGLGVTNPPGIDGQVAFDTLTKPFLPVLVLVGGIPAEVTYAGSAPSLVAGAFQINVRVPKGITSSAAVPVCLTVGGIGSQSTVSIAVE